MSNSTNLNLNPEVPENQEPTPEEIRVVLKPLFEEFNQVLQSYGLKGVEVVDFTTIHSSKIVRETKESSRTILDEYNEIFRKTDFSYVYKDLEIIDFTIAPTSLLRQKNRKQFSAQLTSERQNQIILFLKNNLIIIICKCRNKKNQCIKCPPEVVDENTD